MDGCRALSSLPRARRTDRRTNRQTETKKERKKEKKKDGWMDVEFFHPHPVLAPKTLPHPPKPPAGSAAKRFCSKTPCHRHTDKQD
jgi:hypothetical protein